MRKILVTGGCGYVGTLLVPALIENGFHVTVVDTQWFGNHLVPNENLHVILKDIRNLELHEVAEFEKVIHLGNIANDPAVDLNPLLSWEVNVLATMQLLDKVARVGKTNQFIYASSGSVYGLKDEAEVIEDLSLVPISAYNKTKMIAERVTKSYASNNLKVHNIRPATVCGLSPRMRLDVAVNALTYQALDTGTIKVFGGNQIRPNIHIDDMVAVYIHFLNFCQEIESGEYNAGFENISILQIAQMIGEIIPSAIDKVQTNDPRSYRQNSNKLLATGFTPKKTVRDAIKDMKVSYEQGFLRSDENMYTIKTMQRVLENARN